LRPTQFLIRTLYDDGGYSGGSTESCAAAAAGGHSGRGVDVVVVYKVDRMTRSLAD
jgi:site-specific DNA recombinase